jgi:hypothetical protein
LLKELLAFRGPPVGLLNIRSEDSDQQKRNGTRGGAIIDQFSKNRLEDSP